MANRDTRSTRPRARRPRDGRTDDDVRPRARGRARAPADDTRTAQAELLQNVQQIWLAGMGAIARAQKDGPAAFADAVVEGVRLLDQSRSTAQRIVRDAFESAQQTLQARMGGTQAQGTWDALESLFQTRVQRAMHQLGVPTVDDVRALSQRLAELDESVRRLDARERPPTPVGTRRRAAPTRARTRRTTAPKPAAE